MRQKWLIRLGELEWKRFTHEHAGQDIELIGSVLRGPQMGALARMDGSRYVQINGDFVSALNQGQIRRALARAQNAPARPHRPPRTTRFPDTSRPPHGMPRAVANQPAPVVIVKRRRTFSAPLR